MIELRELIDQKLKIAKDNLEVAQTLQQAIFDRKAKSRQLKEADEVLIMLPTDANKLLMQWKGPFTVTGRVGRNDYKVLTDGKERTYHVNLLKKYHRREESERELNESQRQKEGVLEKACASVIEDFEQGEETSGEDLVEIATLGSGESANDVVISNDLSPERAEYLRELVSEFKEVFTDAPGLCSLIEHSVKLSSERPVCLKPYSVPYSVRDSLKKDLDEMLELGIIERSDSPYASPLVIVKKKDGSNRICVDYRQHNNVTVFDPEPMPTIKDLVQDLS